MGNVERSAILSALFLGWVAAGASKAQPIEVSFPTNVVRNTSASPPIQLTAKLYLPDGKPPYSAVVIIPSSGGERETRETFYAMEIIKAGIAALVVESFRSRGIANSIDDQTLLPGFQTENDAVGALRWLVADTRFRHARIGITGVSKGGEAALNTAFTVRRRWTQPGNGMFAAHAPIVPPCSLSMETVTTTRKPIFFMLAELDDQTPAEPCLGLAQRIRAAGNAGVEVKVYKAAHHSWEALGTKPYYNPLAQNYSACKGHFDDVGALITPDGKRVESHKIRKYLQSTCMTLGSHCCGGSPELKAEAAHDLVSFFKRNASRVTRFRGVKWHGELFVQRRSHAVPRPLSRAVTRPVFSASTTTGW